jgi:hypothetical protein
VHVVAALSVAEALEDQRRHAMSGRCSSSALLDVEAALWAAGELTGDDVAMR